MRIVAGVVAVLLAVGAAGPAVGADVQVRVANVRDGRGVVRAEICGRAEWLGDGCAHRSLAVAMAGVTVVTLRDVPAGAWAVVAFHDRNSDGEVDRSLLGIPQEGVGFSRDPALGLRGPRFEDCAFVVGEAGAVIEVRLRFE